MVDRIALKLHKFKFHRKMFLRYSQANLFFKFLVHCVRTFIALQYIYLLEAAPILHQEPPPSASSTSLDCVECIT